MSYVLELSESGSAESSSIDEILVCTAPRDDLYTLYRAIALINKVRVGSVLLRREDLQLLRPGRWLNDKVINAYTELLSKHYANTYVFSTFVVSMLASRSPDAVASWFDDVDLTAYEFLVIPVHLGVHWTLIVVNGYDIEYYDSMGGFSARACTAVRSLMQAVHRARKGADGDYAIFNMSRCIPQQQNSDDCGVFCCMLARFRIDTSCGEFFASSMAPLLRRRMLHELLAERIIYSYT
ncbi:sentrin-specific protease 1 [Pancytospora philotis]|nr:sentrin-specific protease 1 [Pancytospora philotis]